MRKCRACLHPIEDASRTCEHCGEDLIHGDRPTAIAAPAEPVVAAETAATTSSAPTTSRPIGRVGVLGIIGGIFVLVVVGLAWNTPSAPPTPDYSSVGAFTMCRQFVEARLKAPASAKFPWASEAATTDLGGGKFRVLSYVDSQNSFGAMIRNNYDCSVHWVSGTQWRLDSLDVKVR